MPSPIKPSDICASIVTSSSMLCDKFKQLLNLPIKLCTWFSWAFNADGTLSVAFKNEIGSVGNLIGEPRLWVSQNIPDGHLILNGQAVNRTTYPDLFAVYGTTHGAGDGSTTFNVPDMQNRVFIGVSATYQLGSTGGEASHVLALTEIPAHEHDVKYSGLLTGSNSGQADPVVDDDVNNALNFTRATQSAGGGLAHNNLQPYFAGYYITRAKTL